MTHNTTTTITAHVDHDALKIILEKHKLVFHEIPWRDTYRDDDDGDTYSIIAWDEKTNISVMKFMEIAIETLAISRYKNALFIDSFLDNNEARCSFGYNQDFDCCNSTLVVNTEQVHSSALAALNNVKDIVNRELGYPL